MLWNVRIVFQYSEWDKIRIAAEGLVYLLISKRPPMSTVLWRLQALESAFINANDRPIWKARNCSIAQFLSLFPRTFDLVGKFEYVRLRHIETRTIIDTRDSVLRNCACLIMRSDPHRIPTFKVTILGDY